MKKYFKILSTGLCAVMVMSTMAIAPANAKVVDPVTVTNGVKGVKLSINKSYAKSCSVYRKKASAKKYTLIKNIQKSKATVYTDKKVKSGVKYTYKVINENGQKSINSILRLSAPKNVKIKNNVLTWSKVKGAKKYKIYAAKVTNNKVGTYENISTTKKTQKNLSVNYYYDVENGCYYKYRVIAVNGKARSTYNKTTAKTLYLSKDNITLGKTSDYTGISILWEKSSNIDKYEIYRKDDNGSYTKIKTIAKADYSKYAMTEDIAANFISTYVYDDDLIYNDVNLKDDVKYSYYIKSYKGNESIKSNAATSTVTKYDYKLAVGETRNILSEFIKTIGVSSGAVASVTDIDAIRNILISLYKIEYTSSDTNIVAIDSDGNITTVAPGYADIKIKFTPLLDVTSDSVSINQRIYVE